MRKSITLIITSLALAVAGYTAQTPEEAAAEQSLAARWSVETVQRKPLVELVERDNPLPLYSAANAWALPIPEGVPVVGWIPTPGRLGSWPAIDANGNAVNGGTPIMVDLDLHLASITAQLDDPKLDRERSRSALLEAGMLCLDIEHLPVAWERVGEPYKSLAIKQIRQRNPDAVRYMTDAEVAVLAGKEWERKTIELFVATLAHVKAELPGVRVGYYGLTVQRDVWLSEQPTDGPKVAAWRRLNDKALPIVAASDVLYPTVYQFYHDGGPDGIEYVKLNVGEARRLADLADAQDGGDRWVVSYGWPLYHNSNKERRYTLVDTDDAQAFLEGSFEGGADAAAIWDATQHYTKQGDSLTIARLRLWQTATDAYAEPYAEFVHREVGKQ